MTPLSLTLEWNSTLSPTGVVAPSSRSAFVPILTSFDPAGVLRQLARELGFEIAAIRSLLALQDKPDQTCAIVHGLVKERCNDVKMCIRSLAALQDKLELMIERCNHGHIAGRRVIEVLADHGKCVHDQHLHTKRNLER
jgi:hypothetical protein